MRAASLMLVAVALCGCAMLAPKFETPRLSIVGLEVRKADFWQQQMRVRMQVENPNDRALPVRGLSYTLYVEGQQLATAVSAASFEVPAGGTADFDMDVTANVAGPLLSLLARGRQQVHYQLRGKVELAHGWLRSIPFEERGTLDLK